GQYLEGQWTWWQRELTSGRAFLKYFELLIAPFRIAGDYDFNSIPLATPTDWVSWFGLALIIISLGCAIWIVRSRPIAALGILFFYVTIIPVSNWIFPTSLLAAERFLYIPSLGICLIAGWVWMGISSGEIRKILAVGVAGLAVVLCIADTYIWRDNF